MGLGEDDAVHEGLGVARGGVDAGGGRDHARGAVEGTRAALDVVDIVDHDHALSAGDLGSRVEGLELDGVGAGEVPITEATENFTASSEEEIVVVTVCEPPFIWHP